MLVRVVGDQEQRNRSAPPAALPGGAHLPVVGDGDVGVLDVHEPAVEDAIGRAGVLGAGQRGQAVEELTRVHEAEPERPQGTERG